MTWPGRFNWVCAVEGLDELLTDTDNTSAVTTAWNGTDWTSATGGVFFDLDQEQSAHPWEPFTEGGTLTMTVLDNDIGIVMHRTAGGAETDLTTGIDRDATTVTVKDTSAFPSSGSISIGTETIAYSGTTATTFTGCTRGQYSPFGCDSSGTGGDRFGHTHRTGVTDYAPPLAPKVTQYPRHWVGRWVGLWRHGWTNGTMQTKANATLVFAGRIVEVRDDPATLGTIIIVEHVKTMLKDWTIGRDLFSGTVADGIYIPTGVEFGMVDFNGTSVKTANNLEVVASGASGANQIDAGFYTASELFTKINAWWASEIAATRLHGSYTIAQATTATTEDSIRTKIYWYIAGSGQPLFRFTLHKAISKFLGFNGDPDSSSLGYETVTDQDSAGATHHFVGGFIPLRTWLGTGISTIRVQLENASGSFQEQYDTLPAAVKPANNSSNLDFGVFLLDDRIYVRANVIDNGDGTYELNNIHALLAWFAGVESQSIQEIFGYSKPITDKAPIRIQQVFMFEMPTADFINYLFYSCGTSGMNHGTYDDLPYGIGIGIPGDLLGASWETSVANVPGADKPLLVVIDKPTKISKLIGSDLLLRHVFPVWKNGGLRMGTWQTPSSSLAVAAFTEANKAEPSGNDIDHRASTLLSDRWAKPLIKIRHSRNLAKENGGGSEYQGTINIEDRTALDDAGDRGEPFTIDARHSYSEIVGTGAGIEDIVPNAFIPVVTMFTRAMRTLRRSISADYWEGYAPGDIVTVSDNFARDPSTGIRSVTTRPAIIIRHTYNPGGARPNQKEAEPPVGEVELMFVNTNRIYAYSPSALVSSYTSGTLTLTCAEHEYSEASEVADASRFAAGDAIHIIEVDPADPAAPLTWTRSITSVSGNNIVHDGVALASFDAAKTYRIIPDNYSACQTSQQDKAFQADDTDGLIEDEAQANMFGLAVSTINATASAHTDLPERHAAATYGDGEPYDVGSLVGFARMVENLIEHKTAIQCPMLLGETASNTTYSSGTGYKLVAIVPVFLSTALLNNSIVRYAKIGPWLRSTDGTATSVRITLSTFPSNDDTVDDCVIPTPNTSQTWATSSTTWATGTPAVFTLNVKNAGGIGWLHIECGYKSETRVVASFVEQERSVFA